VTGSTKLSRRVFKSFRRAQLTGFSELIADVRPWGLGKKFKNASAFDVVKRPS